MLVDARPERSAPLPGGGAQLQVRWAVLAAVAGGLCAYVAFPRMGVWPLEILAVALFSVAVDGRRSRTGAWLGLLFGCAFFLPLLRWTGVYVGALPWLMLAASQAAFCAALGAVLPVVQRRRGAPAWIASAWVLEEALRDRVPFGGFPWGRLAFSQA
ncbi:MAG: apolipoprotein N-acyltransferase, partial [Actinomycetota bacterium]|nr:apolipoprotein N-acyltransferase [Actinomycetota bacterium]